MSEADKSAQAYRTISEVAADIGVPQHVLRFWETRFPSLKPLKRGGNRRYYRPADVALLRAINTLLYTEGYTIKGVQKLIATGALRAPKGEAAPEIAVAPAPEATVAPLVAAEPVIPRAAPAPPPFALDTLMAIRDRLAGALAETRAA